MQKESRQEETMTQMHYDLLYTLLWRFDRLRTSTTDMYISEAAHEWCNQAPVPPRLLDDAELVLGIPPKSSCKD